MQVKWTYDDGTYYEGEVNAAGQADGYGYCRYSDGTEYRGQFKDHNWSGQGVLTTTNGNVFEGEFQHGRVHGCVTISQADGAVFKGQMFYGKMQGPWMLAWPDFLFIGTFQDGSYDNGVFEGVSRGTILEKNGTEYTGGVDNRLRPYGKGTQRYSGRNEVSGMWKAGNIEKYDFQMNKQLLYSQKKEPEYTVYYTILEHSVYHIMLIYRGEKTDASPYCKYSRSEAKEVQNGNGCLYIRKLPGGDIIYTVVKSKTGELYYVRAGKSTAGPVLYTIWRNYILSGENGLAEHIDYRIRSINSEKTVAESFLMHH